MNYGINAIPFAVLTTCTILNTFSQAGTAARMLTPPPPAVVIERPATDVPAGPDLSAAATQYSIGDPLPEEQLYIEFINRARANPIAEATLFASTSDQAILDAYDFFNVDLGLMQAQFATILPAPPLAPNALLRNAAIRHSTDMSSHDFQQHTGSDGSTPGTRVRDAGYIYSSVGENIFAYAESVFQGHAGFEVDWGRLEDGAIGGIQNPPGHRNAIHNRNFREIGVGVLFEDLDTTAVGPQLVTQNFGISQSNRPFITGVAYYDLNGNSFYDMGEGIGGVTVNVSGTTTQGITSRSGGYAVPVAGNGIYTVTFSTPGLNDSVQQVTVANAENRKVDFRPTYTPPTISGSTSPQINTQNAYSISPVGGATAYQFRSYQLTPATVEGAENGAANVTANISGNFSLAQSRTKFSGSSAFNLLTVAQPDVREQSFVLNARYVVDGSTTLRFRSRLGWATSTTSALVQVSTDDGLTWQEVYRQPGTSSSGESTFQARTVNLSPFNGSTIRLRFALLPTGPNFIGPQDDETGWFIDDIWMDGAHQIIDAQESGVLQTPNFTFQPTAEADFVLQARARTGHDFLPWGPPLNVRSVQQSTTPPTIQVSSFAVANGTATIEVDLLSGSAPAAWTLESKTNLDGNWSTASTSVEVVSPTRVRFNVPAAQPHQFFRVVASSGGTTTATGVVRSAHSALQMNRRLFSGGTRF
ncbi:MAG TPA: CAP domain-containing protein [Verrucomicrobiae bacterium]